jgi:outer membrane lipoprotein carrier protein
VPPHAFRAFVTPFGLRLVAVLVLLAPAAPGVEAQSEQSPDALARRLQQRYDGIRDFRADFTQVTRREVTRTQGRAEGQIAVKKPGRVRMSYTEPEEKLIVHDGTHIWDYVPEDRTVLKAPAPADDEAPTVMLFLGGRGDILRDFIPSHTVSPVEGAMALKLTPRQLERDYDYLVVLLNPQLQITGIITHNELGGETRITFSNLKENTGIADSNFQFTPPRGVEVLQSGAAR